MMNNRLPRTRILWLAILLCTASKLDALQANRDAYPFHVIMAGDIQYPWTEPHQADLASEKRISKTLIENYFKSMKKIADPKMDSIRGIFLNGDLTAFGQEDELATIRKLLEAPKSWTQVHLGLGNHDYADNVDDSRCPENQCSARMVKYMLEHKQFYSNMDMSISHLKPTDHGNRNTVAYKGSLAYSIDIGDIHFVQLHNYPTYSRQWNTTNDLDDAVELYHITDSLKWLSRDLDIATNQNRSIIICMHDPMPRPAFRDLILKYNVSGIFTGHVHRNVGQYSGQEAYGEVPFFGSDCAMYGTYLLVTFENSTQMRVSAWNAENGDAKKISLENLGSNFNV